MYPLKIGFVGLGHIGGSIAKTIRRLHPDIEITACDPSENTIRQALERDMAELAGYRGKIAELRKAIQAFGKNLEQRTEEMEQQAEELYEAAPKGNLTLFQ